MAPNTRSLWRLQSVYADLARRKAALESLRKQVQRKEAEREAKIGYVGQRTKQSPKAIAVGIARLAEDANSDEVYLATSCAGKMR